jgi:hypothetical protein
MLGYRDDLQQQEGSVRGMGRKKQEVDVTQKTGGKPDEGADAKKAAREYRAQSATAPNPPGHWEQLVSADE